MSTEHTEHRLAREVAQACDAWLIDPLDAGVYQRLITATLRWRHYTRPTLEETAQTPPAPEPTVSPPTREPSRIGTLLTGAGPQEALARLNAAASGAQAPDAAEGEGERQP